jgi:hypothetical protein
MSQLAFVTVKQCDRCKKIEIFSGLEAHERFERDWHEGLTFDFCQHCRKQPDAVKRIEIERQVIEANRLNDRYNGRHEYAH